MFAINILMQAPREIAIQSVQLPEPASHEVLVKTIVSAISPGTEMLFYRGEAPADMPVDSTLAVHRHGLSYPLHYGYACAGVVHAVGADIDPAWIGRRVFAFHPHASAFVAAVDDLLPIPDAISFEQAALLPSTETALNLVMDGAPLVGERILVYGLGVIGLLTTALLARFPAVHVVAVDPLAQRREKALMLGATETLTPEEAADLRDFDLVFELSGKPEVLNHAIKATGFAGRVIVGSWYGTKVTPVAFGGHFHRNRIRLVSSQVSTLAPNLTGRWTKERRINLAWHLMRSVPVTSLITHRVAADDAARAFQIVDQQVQQCIQLLLLYHDEPSVVHRAVP